MVRELTIDCARVARRLERFIARELRARGFRKVILGLSGGIDSSVVAFLAVRALGARNVIGLSLPYRTTAPRDIADAKTVARLLGIALHQIPVTPQIDRYFAQIPADRLRRGNKMARERMSILFDLSRRYRALVIGSGNRTERLLGYFTLYGDSAYALNPLAPLYKAQVRQLAAYLGVPQPLIDKPPTAGLWPGQTDEGELGCSYDEADRLLYWMLDRASSARQLRAKGFSPSLVKKIRQRIAQNRFKLEPPALAVL